MNAAEKAEAVRERILAERPECCIPGKSSRCLPSEDGKTCACGHHHIEIGWLRSMAAVFGRRLVQHRTTEVEDKAELAKFIREHDMESP